MNRIFLSLALLLSLAACKDKGRPAQDAAETVKYISGGEGDILESELVSGIEIIPLETNRDVLFGKGVQLQAAGGDFYVADFVNAKLFRFDSTGAFVNTVGQKGRGPQEFVELSDFFVDGHEVTIFSDLNQAAFVFSPSGQFIEKRDMGKRFQKAFPLQDGTYWLYWGFASAYGDNRLAHTGDGGRILDKELEGRYKVLMMDEGIRPIFNLYGADTILVRESINPGNVIYQIAGGQVGERYSFDFGDYNVGGEYFEKGDPMEAAAYLMSDDFAVIRNFMENKEYALVEVQIQKVSEGGKPRLEMLYGVKDKRGGKWHWFEAEEEDAIFGAPQFLTSDNELICLVDPWKVKRYIDGRSVRDPSKLSGIEENMNPVVLVCRLR